MEEGEEGRRKGRRTFIILGRWLVDDSAVLEGTQVKHAYTSICAARNKHIHAVGAEANIEDFFVVSNQLRLSGQSWDIPDSASGVYARGNYKGWRNGVPVQRSQRSSVLWRLGVGEESKWCQFAGWCWVARVGAAGDAIRLVGHGCVCWERP